MATNMYFTALVLPEELDRKVLKYKNFMFEKYGCKVGLKSPAHITILPPFWMDAELETKLFHATDELSKELQPFGMATNNFSAFKPRTVFIAVQPNPLLLQLKTSSDNYFKKHTEYKATIDTRPFHPHITIATRDLHKKTFSEAWSFFEHKEFSEEWLAEGLSVLRHNQKNWDVLHTSQFSKLYS